MLQAKYRASKQKNIAHNVKFMVQGLVNHNVYGTAASSMI